MQNVSKVNMETSKTYPSGNFQHLQHIQAYWKPCQISKIELFVKIIQPLTIFEKSVILDVWHDSECTTDVDVVF